MIQNYSARTVSLYRVSGLAYSKRFLQTCHSLVATT